MYVGVSVSCAAVCLTMTDAVVPRVLLCLMLLNFSVWAMASAAGVESVLDAGNLHDHAHQGKQPWWHIFFLASFRESIEEFSFSKHMAAHDLCSTWNMDRVVVTVQLTGFGESSADVFFKCRQNVSPIVVSPHVRELGEESLLVSRGADRQSELDFCLFHSGLVEPT